jgi:hypothetical protein
MNITNSITSFSTVDLVKKLDMVKAAALKAPIAVTEHRKPKFILMSVEDYERMRGGTNPHQAFRAEDTPDFILDVFGDALTPRDGDVR